VADPDQAGARLRRTEFTDEDVRILGTNPLLSELSEEELQELITSKDPFVKTIRWPARRCPVRQRARRSTGQIESSRQSSNRTLLAPLSHRCLRRDTRSAARQTARRQCH